MTFDLQLFDKDLVCLLCQVTSNSCRWVKNISVTWLCRFLPRLFTRPPQSGTSRAVSRFCWILRPIHTSEYKPHDAKHPSTLTYSIGWIKDIDYLTATLQQWGSAARIAEKKRAVVPVGKSVLGASADDNVSRFYFFGVTLPGSSLVCRVRVWTSGHQIVGNYQEVPWCGMCVWEV